MQKCNFAKGTTDAVPWVILRSDTKLVFLSIKPNGTQLLKNVVYYFIKGGFLFSCDGCLDCMTNVQKPEITNSLQSQTHTPNSCNTRLYFLNFSFIMYHYEVSGSLVPKTTVLVSHCASAARDFLLKGASLVSINILKSLEHKNRF